MAVVTTSLVYSRLFTIGTPAELPATCNVGDLCVCAAPVSFYVAVAANTWFNTVGSNAAGIGPVYAIRQAFATTGNTSAADVVIWNANAPYPVRVLETTLRITSTVAGSTATLRDATGGGGNALSDAIATATAGTKRSNATTTGTVAAGGSLVLRKSNGTVAGEVVVYLQRT